LDGLVEIDERGEWGGREIKMKMEMMMMTISFDDLYFIV